LKKQGTWKSILTNDLKTENIWNSDSNGEATIHTNVGPIEVYLPESEKHEESIEPEAISSFNIKHITEKGTVDNF
jgi:hypothetical protein